MGIDLGRFKSKRNDEWLDWLADDPVPAGIRARMRAKAVQQASRPVVRRPGQSPVVPQQPVTAKSQDTPTVSINIALPRFKKPKLKLPQRLPYNLTYKRVGMASAVLVGLVAVGVVTIAVRSDNKAGDTGAKGVLSASDNNPDFDALKPDDATAVTSEQRYDPERKVVSYKDSIGGVEITVSQQQLPDGFKDDTEEQVKKLAEGFSATEVLSTANPTAYLGNDVRGPQTVIFAKNGRLVFILSTKKIDNHDWASYITSLQ